MFGFGRRSAIQTVCAGFVQDTISASEKAVGEAIRLILQRAADKGLDTEKVVNEINTLSPSLVIFSCIYSLALLRLIETRERSQSKHIVNVANQALQEAMKRPEYDMTNAMIGLVFKNVLYMADDYPMSTDELLRLVPYYMFTQVYDSRNRSQLLDQLSEDKALIESLFRLFSHGGNWFVRNSSLVEKGLQ